MQKTSGKAILNAFITTALVVILLTASYVNMTPMVLGDGPAPITNSSATDVSNASVSGEPGAGSAPPCLFDAGANVSFLLHRASCEAGQELPANVSVATDRTIYDPLDNVTLFVRSPAGVPSAYVVDPAGNTSRLNLMEYGGGYYSVFSPGAGAGNYSVEAMATLPDWNVSWGNASFTVGDNTTYTVENVHGLNVAGQKTPGNESKNNGKDTSIKYAIYDPAKKIVILKNDSGDTMVPADDESMDTISKQYGVDRNLTKASMTVTKMPDGKTLHISLDNKTDGCWYRLSAPIPSGYEVLGVYRDNGSVIPDKRRVNGNASQDLAEWYVENNIVYFFDDPASGYDVVMQSYVYGQEPVANKTLYLRSNMGMNTTPNAGDWSVSIGGLLGGSKTWTQGTAFAKDFTLTNSVSLYLYTTAGLSLLGSTSISLDYYSPDVGTRNLWSGSNFGLLNLGGAYKISVQKTLSSNITIKKGGYFTVTVTYGGLLASGTIYQDVSSNQYNTIEMYTPSYINVDNICINNSSSGNVITSTTTPANVKAWANVSDPFGAWDISGVNATLYYPNGTVYLGPTAMSRTGGGTEWNTYLSSNFSLVKNMDGGYYNMYVWATETNGAKMYNNTQLYVYGPPSMGVNKSIAYASGNNFTVTIQLKNNRNWEQRSVYAYDFYPTGPNGFTASGFNPSGSYPTTVVGWNGGGNAVSIGPFTIPAQGVTTITYTLTGSGNYNVSNLNIVGVDPP